MTLQGLLNDMEISVNRKDLENRYKDWINSALRYIEQRYSWAHQKKIDRVTITKGNTLCRLPGDFKELQRGRSPIGVVAPTTANNQAKILPCEIKTPQEIERLNTFGTYNGFVWYGEALNPYQYTRLPIWVDWQNNDPTINIIAQATGDVTFQVRYYSYSCPLEELTDENALTRNYDQMVLFKAREIAFSTISDENADYHGKKFEEFFLNARKADGYAQAAGVKVQM